MKLTKIMELLKAPLSADDRTAIRHGLRKLYEPRLAPYVWEIDTLFRDGLQDEAARRITLILSPKFKSVDDYQKQYDAARGVNR